MYRIKYCMFVYSLQLQEKKKLEEEPKGLLSDQLVVASLIWHEEHWTGLCLHHRVYEPKKVTAQVRNSNHKRFLDPLEFALWQIC
ncbi:hypothetical protein HanXRQr2_Chr10g0426511 [Helianthus annuus]|uniref:Uncharacterized protein n=1 Tax=Helianthus annuus TaxID=4232 RepID=A0A9K3N3N0_HELAN|nr:hypothetical protein HanXRQr2_Chr10g0426511 [Helianthus annuus]